jgi:AraC-like DNA-binding protein
MNPTAHSSVSPPVGVDFAEHRISPAARISLIGSTSPEVRYVRAGCGIWSVGRRRHRVVSGDILISSSRELEQVEADNERGLVLEVLAYPEAIWAEQLPAGAPEFLHRSPLASECDATMRDCRYEKALVHPGWERYMTNRAQLFLVHLYRFMVLRETQAPRADSSSDLSRLRVREYVRTLDGGCPGALETMDAVASKMGLGPRRFSELFREITGTTWLKYVHSRQILRAQKLLSAKEDRVGAIALQSGFEDEATFYRVFKKNTGTTPGEWRARARRLAEGVVGVCVSSAF